MVILMLETRILTLGITSLILIGWTNAIGWSDFRCPNGHFLSSFDSLYRASKKEERLYSFECQQLEHTTGNGALSSPACGFSDSASSKNGDLFLQCPESSYVGGVLIAKDQDHYLEWKLLCCATSEIEIQESGCFPTRLLNEWKGLMDYTLPDGHLIRSFQSIYDSKKLDRRWWLEICPYGKAETTTTTTTTTAATVAPVAAQPSVSHYIVPSLQLYHTDMSGMRPYISHPKAVTSPHTPEAFIQETRTEPTLRPTTVEVTIPPAPTQPQTSAPEQLKKREEMFQRLFNQATKGKARLPVFANHMEIQQAAKESLQDLNAGENKREPVVAENREKPIPTRVFRFQEAEINEQPKNSVESLDSLDSLPPRPGAETRLDYAQNSVDGKKDENFLGFLSGASGFLKNVHDDMQFAFTDENGKWNFKDGLATTLDYLGLCGSPTRRQRRRYQ